MMQATRPTRSQLDWHREKLAVMSTGSIWLIGGPPYEVPMHAYIVNTAAKTVTLLNKEVASGEYHEFTKTCLAILGYKMID
jgi:hypothetical protein